MLGKKVWFNMNHRGTYMKVGIVIDGFYDGLLQVQEVESGSVYIVAPKEITPIC